jgi:16S rRNA (cytosine1402-N4)-methyltransferase
MPHIPVLLDECLEFLRPERGGIFVDATLGLGGHSEAMLKMAAEAGKNIELYGIDQDPEAAQQAKERLGNRFTYLAGNFADMEYLLKQKDVTKADGILMDLGVSSFQIDTPERGFSFREDGPLDMRMDPEGMQTAATIVNTWPESKLADLFFQYGEERLSRKIARVICERRLKEKFYRTADLAYVIAGQYPPNQRYKHPHPATRVFQALRIEVNQELQVLERGMEAGLSLLNPGGVLAIISFHSLEDRPVKLRFREAVATEEFELLTKKPVMASEEEIEQNSRSRSAKLRVIKRKEN